MGGMADRYAYALGAMVSTRVLIISHELILFLCRQASGGFREALCLHSDRNLS